jgi:hypothetical protein
MRISIEPENASFTTRTFGTKTVREQIGYAHLEGNKYPVQIKFTLPESQAQAYPVGQFHISPESFQVGKYSKLEINPFELYLTPSKPSANRVAA